MRFKFLFFFFLALFAPFHAEAQDSFACQNFFGRFTPATPHDALTNSAYFLEYSKLGSVFIVMKDGLPYYAPYWRFGVFTHSYSPVTLEGGTLSSTPGSFSSFHRGDLLALAGVHQTDSEVRLKLISYKKYSIKAGSTKETDRVTLELVIPKGSGWCTAQRSFETWLKGFGGMLEMERYQKIGESPASPPAPAQEASEKKASQKKSKEERAAEREASSPAPAPVSPSPPPPVTKEAPVPPPPAKETSSPPASSGSGQKEISFKTGMSRSEVDKALGAPHQVMKLGDKTICYYDDVVIEFEKDKLTSIRLSDKPSGEVLKRFH
jgi:hypothetical protein